MTPLPTLLRLLHGLAVAALVALAAIHGSTQPNTQDCAPPAGLSAVLARAESSLGDETGAASWCALQCTDPQATLDLDEPESEDDQELPALDGKVLTRLCRTPLPLLGTSDYAVMPVVERAALPRSSGHPRAPPQR